VGINYLGEQYFLILLLFYSIDYNIDIDIDLDVRNIKLIFMSKAYILYILNTCPCVVPGL
jgi:hypothetical protein